MSGDVRRRSLAYEREATREAARGLADPTSIIHHAESRSLRLSSEYVTDPMLVSITRDRVDDVREELADARNHLVWWLEEHHADHPLAPQRLEALGLIVLAYEKLADE